MRRTIGTTATALVWTAVLLPACGSDSTAAAAGDGGNSAGAGTLPGAGGGVNAGGTANPGAGGGPGAGGSAAGGGSGTGGGTAAGGSPGVLDPAPGTYGQRAELVEANSEMAVAELDGKIYVVGGYPADRQPRTTVQVYDTATDSWSLAAPLPDAVHHPVVVGHAGKLYSLGGQGPAADSDRTLSFDPLTDGPWTDLAPMPTARGAGAGAVIDDRIYVVGGRPGADNAFEVYDVGDDAWTPLPDLPQTFPNRNHLAAAAIGGKIYVAGGRYGGGSFADPMTDSLDVFDPTAGSWSQAAPMLRPRGGVNGVLAFGCFHVWGGEGANTGEPNNVFPDHDVYDPRNDSWAELADLPTPIHGVTGAAFVNGVIYMPGGGTQQGGSSGSRIFQVYRPDVRCE